MALVPAINGKIKQQKPNEMNDNIADIKANVYNYALFYFEKESIHSLSNVSF